MLLGIDTMTNFHLCGPNLTQYLFDYKRHAFGMTVTGVGTGVTEGEGTLNLGVMS